VKKYFRHLFLLVIVVFLSSCSSTYTPTANDPTPSQPEDQLINLVGDWTGTITNTNCLPSSSTNVTLKLREGSNGLYGNFGNSEAVIPVWAVQLSNSDIGVYDNLNSDDYLFTMQLEASGDTVLTGTFSEISAYACENYKTVGRVYLQK
jgi:hypothetical protein